MPLPTDEKLTALSDKLLEQFGGIFGLHPGFRPAHARGILLTGQFTPSTDAASLTRAPHMNQPMTPVTARFSDSSGFPEIPDTDPNANPRGLAIRFHLGEHVHTDIVSHSTDSFPTHTGDEFLAFLQALAASGSGSDASALDRFFQSHPAALAFVQAPKPFPVSFASTTYFGVTAMKFISQPGSTRYGRYRIVPEGGDQYLDELALKNKGPNYLFDEIEQHGTIRFTVSVQLANDGDVVDDATISWPADRTVMALGTLTLDGIAPRNASEQKHIIFDPIPRVDGIEPSADPLLELRAAIYLLSGRRRRSAPE